MKIDVENVIDPTISCDSCQACCCRLEVMLITETGVPEHFVDIDAWGGQVMARLDDGWCAALNRDTFKCRIYNNRPLNCRVLEMGSYECIEERNDFS